MTKKKSCKCPPKTKSCRPFPKNTDCKDIVDIVAALAYEDELMKPKRTRPKFKTKKFKPRHFKDTCVPMVPSMHTRLGFIGHCSLYPPKSKKHGLQFTSSSSDESCGTLPAGKQQKFKKRVRYYDLMPGDITLNKPAPIVKHSCSNESILNVGSPKTSGDVIAAQRASVEPWEVRPPLPDESRLKLRQPHSGVIINKDKSFVDDAYFLGPKKLPGKKIKPCYKGGPCARRDCKDKSRHKQSAMKHKRKMRSASGKDGGIGRRGSQKRFQMELKGDRDTSDFDESIPRPQHAQIPADMKKGMFRTHSLTVMRCSKDKKPDVNYGILTGSFNMYNEKFGGRSKGRQALTMSVMAYCLAFHYHPKQWTMKLVDNLIDAGDTWYLQCLDKIHDHSAVQGICEVLPFGKKQTLVLNQKKMKVLLGEPEVVGYTMSMDPTIYNLCRGLKAFFKENRAAIFLSRVLKVVIWRDRVCYYIFDPAGRDSRAYSNFTKGHAALINVKDLESVADVLLARSILEDQKFVLAPVKVLKMADEKSDVDFESDIELTQAEKVTMGYRILNENCAIVNANMHLGDRCFEDAKFRQALPMAVAAMTYAKISPPNTWFAKTLDKVLRLGNKLYTDCAHPKVMIDLTIDNIPNEIIVGPYACEIIIYRERVKGQLFTTKECLFNVTSGIEEFFSHEYNSGILDFNNYILGIWRQKDMYYLFDPYPRTSDGLRTVKSGRACCWMLLNTDTMADVFKKNWDYLPPTTHFCIHAFKVLKLKKREKKTQLICTLSDEQLPGVKVKRQVLMTSQAKGDGRDVLLDVLHVNTSNAKGGTGEAKQSLPQLDEEQMGDIISLVDSIQEDYLPPIPLRYKHMGPEPMEPKVVNLDSPTVSVTQVVPPWPKPRDKTNEPPEPDPDPEPTPPPTPPPVAVPEGGAEEEEAAEEEEEEDDEEGGGKKDEKEEAGRKAEELPPPMPPPPPSPQPESEVELAPPDVLEDDEVETLPPVVADRRILLTEDAIVRYKIRQLRREAAKPLSEHPVEITASEELSRPHNFKKLLDGTEIIRGETSPVSDKKHDILPFVAIMAVVTSYKYTVSTWTSSLVDFVVNAARKLYEKKREKFQAAPAHILPKVTIGHQTYQVHIDVAGEGPTWQLEDILARKFLTHYDRGMMTTSSYSCAFFQRNGLYYLMEATICNAMGLRQKKKGKPCFMRFLTLHELVSRILYNKDGKTQDQQFILSRILVRRLLLEPRLLLTDEYDYDLGMSTSKKQKMFIAPRDKRSSIDEKPVKESQMLIGYHVIDGNYRIEGTTSLKGRNSGTGIKACHFVCLMAMLMATMHPIRTWDHVMIDVCIEKGLEIHEKATNLSPCEKRIIKNVILDGKIINVNIKKIIVINDNAEKKLEQYLNAVLRRLRYVIVRFPTFSLVICQTEGYYHIFDPYPSPKGDSPNADEDSANDSKDSESSKHKSTAVASWTLYRSIDDVIKRIKKVAFNVKEPEFYTFELTSVKKAPRHSAFNYRLSPLFKRDDNPNVPYLKRRVLTPTVDEKMYWLNVPAIPWSRMNSVNDLGFDRNTPRTLWRAWDIEFPGDLYSIWGSIHPLDSKFEANRGKQYLATCVLAIAMVQACDLSAWTGSIIDGVVNNGDKYHQRSIAKIEGKPNYEMNVTDLNPEFKDMFPYSFNVRFAKVIYGFVYNMYPDRFNLTKALTYFFEENTTGILVCPVKNLAFGKIGASYFMFDCQSYGLPLFCPGQGSAYMLKCESLNRLIYCLTLTLNVRRHGQEFHLFSVHLELSESQ